MNAPARIETALERALALAAVGFYVFPSWAKDRHIPGWPQRATGDAAQIRKWFEPGGPYSRCWPSIFCGKFGDGSRALLAVDVDPRGKSALDSLESLLPDTRVHRTPRGGFHGFYSMPFPGVKSGTNVLADGVDIRSKGGLVHFGEGYVLEQDEPIAEAPAALVDKCGSLAPVTAPADRAQDRIAPDQEMAIQRAEELLRAQPIASEGGRNKALHLFICRVREACATDAGSTELIGVAFAHEKCSPPYPEGEARATIASAIKSAQNAAGSKAALPSDFPAIRLTATPTPDTTRTKPPEVVRMADLRAEVITSKPWLVESFFQPGTLVCVFGEPGEGKSVLCGDLAHSVASGRAWLGQFKTRQGAALYVALEGYGSMQRRLLALRQQYGDAPVALATGRFNLATKEGREELAELAAAAIAAVGPLALIVFDTWARLISLAGANENSASDVGRIADALELLGERTGAAVAVVHHSGKSSALGARGSNALLGAVQTEIELADKTVRTRKQRDADEHAPVGFKLVPVAIGMDPAGESVTAPLVQPAAHGAPAKKLPPQAWQALKALQELSPTNAPVAEKDWQAAFERAAWRVDPPGPATRKRAFRRAVEDLGERVVRSPEGAQWTRRCE